MRSYGDIPEIHLELLEELVALEKWFNESGTDLPIMSIAKGLVCIGHDYYVMEMEEEGDRLFVLADRYCPGYFKGPVYSHAAKDIVFASLIKSLKPTLAYNLMLSLGFEDGQI